MAKKTQTSAAPKTDGVIVDAEIKVIEPGPSEGDAQVPGEVPGGGKEPAAADPQGGQQEPAAGQAESTLDASQEPAQAVPQGAQRAFLDAATGGFDPTIHQADADGKPVMTKDGQYAKKRGRKAGQQNAPAQEAPPVSVPPPQVPPAGTKEMAAVITRTFTVFMSKMVGDEWSPTSKAELDSLQDATEKYLVSIGGFQLSPGHAVIIAYAGYSMARLGHENTRGKLSRFTDWAMRQARGLFSLFRR